MKNGIFISYRREDSEGFARSLFQSLIAHFGFNQVFMDVEDIELGLDFIEAIDNSLSSCGVLLVLIGREWLSCVDEDGQPRLDNPEDFVRMEVASALRRNVRVIPVLVRGSIMPKAEQLPDELKPLTRRQALELHHDRWSSDIARLITALEKTLGITPEAATEPKKKQHAQQPETKKTAPKISTQSSKRSRPILAGAAIILALLVSAVLLLDSTPEREVAYTPTTKPSPPSVAKPVPVYPKAKTDPRPQEPSFRPTPEAQMELKPSYNPEMVLMTQELLTEMGYRPGPIDGQLGGQTTRAIQAFQRDRGLTPDGQVTERLVGILNEAFIQQQQQPAAGYAPLRPETVNMAGTWYDDEGFQYFIEQRGNMIRYQAVIPIIGTAVGMGEGNLNGHNLEYRYVVADGSQGVGRGVISEDGRHMEYVATDLATGLRETGVLHREHMRQ